MGLTQEERARIEAKGGVITTVKDLLGLDDLDLQIIEARLRIGREVKRRRESAGLTKNELAERMGVSRTRIPAVEGGGRSSLEAVVSAFLATGGGLEELGATIAGKGLAADGRIVKPTRTVRRRASIEPKAVG